MIKILFVCHGNICRSTMAESVMTYFIKNKHLEDYIQISSAATSTEEIGHDVHHGTKKILSANNIPVIPHRAVQMCKADYDIYDFLVGMDNANIYNILRIVGHDSCHKVTRLLEYAHLSRDIADPWYTGDFQQTYDDIFLGCSALLEYLLVKEDIK